MATLLQNLRIFFLASLGWKQNTIMCFYTVALEKLSFGFIQQPCFLLQARGPEMWLFGAESNYSCTWEKCKFLFANMNLSENTEEDYSLSKFVCKIGEIGIGTLGSLLGWEKRKRNRWMNDRQLVCGNCLNKTSSKETNSGIVFDQLQPTKTQKNSEMVMSMQEMLKKKTVIQIYLTLVQLTY